MAAGLGFKTFTTGEVLTAADTNGYLMQGVLVFASAAARDAAITSPQEGQFAYLKDTNVTTYYTGAAWANLDTTGMTNPMTTTGDIVYASSGSTPGRIGIGSTGDVLTVAGGIPSWAAPAGGGKVLQVVQGTLTAYTATTSTSYTTTGLTQPITPSSVTSKVLVMVNLSSAVKTSGNAATALQVKLLRGATEISFAGDNIGHTAVNDKNNFGSVAFSYLDSPSTTSATTYVVHFASKTSGQEVGINDYTASNTAVSSIVLLEIGA